MLPRRLLRLFEDDQPHAFQVNTAFKVWAPLSDVPDSFIYFEPGSRPRLLLHSPPDYWHEPAALPQAYLTHYFDIIPVADREAARKALTRIASTTAYLGDIFPELAIRKRGLAAEVRRDRMDATPPL